MQKRILLLSCRMYRAMLVIMLVLCSGLVYAQGRVTGQVTGSDDGLGLPGVNVLIKGTSSGTVTDSEGKYSIEVPAADAVLVFSSIGYATEEVPVNGRSVIDISMLLDITQLSEVVVVGYGTVKKSDVTGSIIQVSGEEMKSRPVMNAIEAMQGKAAGVDITSNERPGELGQVRIRGERSLTASNSPLYVVDGVPLMSPSGIETLNPLDIESIDVLKDASATAIYGSRGANGVIVVTTRKGKEGRVTFNYNGAVTVETLQDRMEMMDASEYITWRRWAYYYADPVNNPRGDQPDIDKDMVYFLAGNDPYAWANIERGWEGGTWDGSRVQTTDWMGMVTQTAVTHTHTLSASGGNEKAKAYASFGYTDNEGTMKGQHFTRYSTNISVDLTPVEWFQMGLSLNTAYSIQQYGQSTTGGSPSSPGSIYAAARGVFPYAVPYDDNGEVIVFPGGDDVVKTIVNEWTYTDNERRQLRALGSLYAQANILPGLRYRINFGPDFRNYKNGLYIDERSVIRLGSPNLVSLTNRNDFSWTLDNLIFYDKVIGQHSFNATLLQTASSWNTNDSYIKAEGVPLPSQKWNNFGSVPIQSNTSAWSSGLTERQLMSYMARVAYGFNDKYLLTVSGRWDGASQLAEGNKWAFFPSAALAWRMDQEDFIANTPWVSQLKLRLGVGTTGNAAIDPYETKGEIVSLFYPYGSTLTQGYVPSEIQISGGDKALANQSLGWEKTTQFNLGIDFGVLNDRISGTIDLYQSHTKDLLLAATIPSVNGFTRTFENIGETRNRGIDITLNTINIQQGEFEWSSVLNAAWQKDEIVSLANGKEDDISNNWFIGESIGVIYGYEGAGLWQAEDQEEMDKYTNQTFTPGSARPVDQNNDYRIDPDNDRVIIGQTRPRWTVGMTNTFRYKNFDLSIFIFGRLGYTFNTNGEWQGGRYTQRLIDYYTETNTNAEYQKPVYNVAGGDPFFGVLGYRSGSFLKIRNINLGYTFPRSITSKIGLQNLKLYVQARNPGIIYSKIDWLDMDLGGSTWNRGYVVGVNVDF